VSGSDVTDQLRAEEEIAALVEAAASGDFSQRVDVTQKQGFLLQVAQGLNQLLDNSSAGLAELQRMLSALADGDLNVRVEGSFAGVFADLQLAANTTSERLAEIIGQITEAAETIGTATREIAAGNMNLSSRTEQQAASLEETASSVEELAGTVRQNAGNARQANDLTTRAAEVAWQGGEMVSQVVTTMNDINAASRKIVDIISVIDGIAFQTNILALNAAVEAARAGEQGRGFAVVASEVRGLAQRSAAAAKEIKGLISDSVSQVETGARVVNQAGETMQDIVSSVNRVATLMSRDQCRQSGAESGYRSGEPDGDQPGRHDTTECRTGGAGCGCCKKPGGAGADAGGAVRVFRLAGSEKASIGKLPAHSRMPVLAGPQADEWNEF
jgi:methyl-accepting chemotaxis protein